MRIFFLILAILVIGGVFIYRGNFGARIKTGFPVQKIKSNGNNMEINSPAFGNNATIPVKYTCDGEGINPPLTFRGIPEQTKNLVLIIDDPDAPMGTFTHWLVFNIDPTIKQIGEGSLPEGSLQGINSAGKISYMGPCPPSGIHHYHFKLSAVDEKLNLSTGATKEKVEKEMQNHIISQAELVGLYGK